MAEHATIAEGIDCMGAGRVDPQATPVDPAGADTRQSLDANPETAICLSAYGWSDG